jgi:hypothetical protein
MTPVRLKGKPYGRTIMNDEHKNPNILVTPLPHAEFPPAPDGKQQGQRSRAEMAWLSEVSGGTVTAQGDPIQVVPTGG